jgi:hypothetical protein
MTKQNWFRKLLASAKPRTISNSAWQQNKLAVTLLEDRLVLDGLISMLGSSSQQLSVASLAANMFTGGVFVASGDVTGDGLADIVTSAGPGGGPHIRVFDGKSGQIAWEFMAYAESFSGGVTVAVGDVTGDGQADIVTGAGPGGGPHIKVFDGATKSELYGFYAFDPSFTGGTRIAVGDINGDKQAEIAVSAWSQTAEIRLFVVHAARLRTNNWRNTRPR